MSTLDEADITSLAAQRCLVLGASGFIGTNLCLSLCGRVKTIRAFSRQKVVIEGVDSVQGDFLDNADLAKAIQDIDVVFHLISTNTPASSNAAPLADAQQNILQTLELLELCRA